METQRPGKEIPPDYKKIVAYLIDTQGWRYELTGKHPRLYPPNKDMGMIPVPTTPGDRRSLQNFIAQVKRAGGVWPPPGKGKA